MICFVLAAPSSRKSGRINEDFKIDENLIIKTKPEPSKLAKYLIEAGLIASDKYPHPIQSIRFIATD